MGRDWTPTPAGRGLTWTPTLTSASATLHCFNARSLDRNDWNRHAARCEASRTISARFLAALGMTTISIRSGLLRLLFPHSARDCPRPAPSGRVTAVSAETIRAAALPERALPHCYLCE